jgi:hypothetical protein
MVRLGCRTLMFEAGYVGVSRGWYSTEPGITFGRGRREVITTRVKVAGVK